jgi:hypothetical protein
MIEKLTPELIRKRRIDGFLLIAGEELDGASRFAEPLPRQAVEKLLRAVLELENFPAGPSHNIMGFAQLLPSNHDLRDMFLEFDDLSSASTRYRYPNERGVVRSVDSIQVKSRLSDIQTLDKRVRLFIKTHLK